MLGSILKAIMTAITAGAVLIAAFYLAYLLLIIFVLAVVGYLAYQYFNRSKSFSEKDFPD